MTKNNKDRFQYLSVDSILLLRNKLHTTCALAGINGYVQRLEALGVPFPVELGIDNILKSLPPSFVMNYNMHGMNKTLVELFAMLKVAEKDL